MPRRSAHTSSKLDRLPACARRGVPSKVRALPWVALAQVGVVLARRWRALSNKDRARLTRLARASRGRPGNLSVRERVELRALVRKLDLGGIAGELYALTRRGGGRRGRRRARK